MAITREEKKGWWGHIRDFIKTNTSLAVIIAAALLLELTTGALYYTAQNIIQDTTERLVKEEMSGIAMNIRKQLAKLEMVINNYAWVVSGDLENSERMFETTRALLEHNPYLRGCGVGFTPNYYPERGYWFEPYAVRRPNGTIESMQLGSASHDYTKNELYIFTLANDSDHWSEPYFDRDGARSMVITYSSPVHDKKGATVAVAAADISLGWLKDLTDAHNNYKSTRRYLVSRDNSLLAGQDSPFYRDALKQLLEDKSEKGYVTITDAAGDKQHVFYFPVGGITAWKLICVCSDDEVFGKLRTMRLLLLLPVMLGLLIVGFMVWRSSRNLERLRRANAEKERISGELRVASQIQQSMLPCHHMRHDDVEIGGSLVPAREVGGDLYDYFIRDEKLFFCIGDVSGKGAPSAMVMGVVHSLFRAFSAHENNPAHIMQAINEASCRGNDENIFVTLFIGVLDLPTGHLRYCNAGHEAPILKSSRSSMLNAACAASPNLISKGSMLNVQPNLPVGVFDDFTYTAQEAQIAPGSTLFLYTDGLTEAKRAPKEWFGLQRTQEVLDKCAAEQLTPVQILEKVTEEVHRFVGDAEQSDDLTMLAIHYTPRRFESTLTETLVLTNDVQEVSRLSTFMKAVTERMGIEKSLGRQLRLAVEEAVVNVIDYAYPAGSKGTVEISMTSDGHTVRFRITDTGIPFDPTEREQTDTTLPAEDRQIGGLGLLLVRELMDSINYERLEGKNVLTLGKSLKFKVD